MSSLESYAEGLAAPAVASVWVKVLVALLRKLGLGTFFLCEVEKIPQMRFSLSPPSVLDSRMQLHSIAHTPAQ